MDYEYVALVDQPRHGLYWDELVAEGWYEWMKIPFWTRPDRCGPGPSCVYVMRKPKDEPRMWTEAELRRFMRKRLTLPKWMDEDARRAFVTCQEKELVKSILEDAQTEADMQTAWNKDLLKRNAELQAAIDKVVAISKQPRPHGAVCRLLWPLATKEESNGL